MTVLLPDKVFEFLGKAADTISRTSSWKSESAWGSSGNSATQSGSNSNTGEHHALSATSSTTPAHSSSSQLTPLQLAEESQNFAVGMEKVVEKVMYGKLYDCLFGRARGCAERDTWLARRLLLFSECTFEDMDLPSMPVWLAPSWHFAGLCLQHMNRYTCPADKLRCLWNACQVVSTSLQFRAEMLRERDREVGADLLLPALIHLVLHHPPDRLYSNLRYCSDFARPSTLNSEAGYVLTNILSAVSFARSANPEVLHKAAPPPSAGGAVAEGLLMKQHPPTIAPSAHSGEEDRRRMSGSLASLASAAAFLHKVAGGADGPTSSSSSSDETRAFVWRSLTLAPSSPAFSIPSIFLRVSPPPRTFPLCSSKSAIKSSLESGGFDVNRVRSICASYASAAMSVRSVVSTLLVKANNQQG